MFTHRHAPHYPASPAPSSLEDRQAWGAPSLGGSPTRGAAQLGGRPAWGPASLEGRPAWGGAQLGGAGSLGGGQLGGPPSSGGRPAWGAGRPTWRAALLGRASKLGGPPGRSSEFCGPVLRIWRSRTFRPSSRTVEVPAAPSGHQGSAPGSSMCSPPDGGNALGRCQEGRKRKGPKTGDVGGRPKLGRHQPPRAPELGN